MIYSLKKFSEPAFLTGALNIAANVARMGASLVTVPVVLSSFGDEGLGLWLVCLSIMGMIGVLQTGLGGAIITTIGQSNAIDRQEAPTHHPTNAIALALFYSSLTIAIGIALSFSVDWPRILKISGISAGDAANSLLAMFVCVGCSFPAGAMRDIIVGRLHGYAAYTSTIVGTALSLAAFLIAGMAGAPIFWLIYTFYLPQSIVQLFSGYLWLSRRSVHPFDPAKISFASTWALAKRGYALSIHALAQSIPPNLNLLAIGFFVGAPASATYGIAFRLFGIPMMLLGPINDAMWPEYSKAWAGGRRYWIYLTARKLLLRLLLLSVASVVLLSCFYPWITRIWLGEQSNAPLALIMGMSFWTITATVIHSFNVVLKATGHTRHLLSLSLSAFGFNMLIGFFAIDTLGPTGAIWATVACNIIFIIIPCLLTFKKLIDRGRQLEHEEL